MAWGGIQTATQLTNITNTEQFFAETIGPMTPAESVEIHFELDPDATSPVDDLQVNFYAALETSSQNWDDTPFQSLIIANTPDPNKISFTIHGKYQIRVGAVALDGGDTHLALDMEYRLNGVDV